MAKLLKLRRGTTTQHGSFTGAEGEVTIDTTKDTAVVHDGAQAGGRPLAREDMNNVSSASIVGQITASALAGTKVQPNFGSQDIETTGNIDLSDSTGSGNNRIKLGTGDDLELYHNGTRSEIINNTGDLIIQASANNNLLLRAQTGETHFKGFHNGQTELYYDGSRKLHTRSDAVNIIGDLDMNDADNYKINLGLGSDLQIHHDGSHSNLDNSTGYLKLRSNQIALQNAAGDHNYLSCPTNEQGIELYYDNVKKFNTTSGGVEVTGNIIPEANNTRNIGDGTTNFNSIWASNRFRGNDSVSLDLGNSIDLKIRHNGTDNLIEAPTGHDLKIMTGTNDNANETCATFENNGAVKLYYDNGKKFETFASGTKHYGQVYLPSAGDSIQWTGANSNAFLAGMTSGVDSPQGSGEHLQFHHWNGSAWEKTLLMQRHSLSFPDSNSLNLGDSNDLQIYHESGYNIINTLTAGNLDIKNGSEYIARFAPNGNNELFYDNSKKLETTSWGTQVNGTFKTSGGGISILTDGEKFTVGASDDLEIYHDGSNSYIKENGTGDLFIRNGNDDAIRCRTDAAVELYHNNVKKFETATHGLFVQNDSDIRLQGGSWTGEYTSGIKIQPTASASYFQFQGTLEFRRTNGAQAVQISQSGDLTATGNVTAYSDARLKTDVNTINNALGICGKLRGVSYKWIANGKPSIGVIAQEVEEILPEVVLTNVTTDPDTGKTTEVKSVDYGKIVGVLINAINELKEELEIHKAECAKHHGGQ